MQAMQAAITQQQMRAHPSVGPSTTRIQETIGPDGQRTRVVVNETTFQLSRQPTPVPATSRTESPQTADSLSHASANLAPHFPPNGLQHQPQGPFAFPHTTLQHQHQLPFAFPPTGLQYQQQGPLAFPPTGFQHQQQGPLAFPPSSLQHQQRGPLAFPPTGLQHQQQGPLAFPPPPAFPLGERPGSLPQIPDFLHQPPAFVPIPPPDVIRANPSTNTTAWLLSSPNGPQALVFAPGHGLFTTTPTITQPSTRIPRPRDGLRFQQSTLNGYVRPQNNTSIPALPFVDPAVANAHTHQATEAVIRARNAAAAARQAAAQANANANNEILRNILNRIWTFIKLYFVIFMFTEPGTWFRWICLILAGLMSAMPSAPVFRGFTARLQANIDGFLQPPAPPAPAPPLRQQIEGQRQEGGPPATDAAMPPNNSGARGQAAGPDPAATAARLVQEHRQRHLDVLREAFGRAERAVGLFIASLIPGVGERHVRAREEARREVERVERERETARVERLAVEEEEKRKGRDGDEKALKGVAEEVGESSSASAEKKPRVDELGAEEEEVEAGR